MKLQLALGLGLGAHRIVDRYGNMPAVFTVTAGDGTDYIRVQVSEATTVTPAGDTSIRIGNTGEFVTTPLNLAANTNQDIYFSGAGSFIIPRRKLVTLLYLYNIDSSVITGDITGMALTYLYLYNTSSSITGDITGMALTNLHLWNTGSSITGNITGMALTFLYLIGTGNSITGDITGMALTNLYLWNTGSSITGDITGMALTYLYLWNTGSSITGNITGMALTNLTLYNTSSSITGDITGMALTYLYLIDTGNSITGDITGMALTRLYLNNVGSSLTYGTNSLNITNNYGIQLLGDTVFATATEYAQLIHDAATGTWGGVYPFIITAGTTENCPDWDTVKADVAVLLTKASWTIIPSAWLYDNGGTWPEDWNVYTGE